jgi:hypothetical protein
MLGVASTCLHFLISSNAHSNEEHEELVVNSTFIDIGDTVLFFSKGNDSLLNIEFINLTSEDEKDKVPGDGIVSIISRYRFTSDIVDYKTCVLQLKELEISCKRLDNSEQLQNFEFIAGNGFEKIYTDDYLTAKS